LPPAELRSLDAIHLATVAQLRASIARIVTYDERMVVAADAAGFAVASPA
jgi:predicted nucleic acid-binding protein